MKKTGIFIRAQFVKDGKWQAIDIGDSRLSDGYILTWLRSRGGHNPWAENVVLALLGREQIAK